MKKIITLTLFIFCWTVALMAQEEKELKFSVGPELSIAAGSFSGDASFGIGASGQVEFKLQDRLYGTGTLGVIFYNGKSVANTNTKTTGATVIPIRVGAKYFLTSGLYGMAQIGVAFISNNAVYNGTAFAYSPLSFGYEFTTKPGRSFDAAIKYDGYSGSGGTIGAIGVRFAYIF